MTTAEDQLSEVAINDSQSDYNGGWLALLRASHDEATTPAFAIFEGWAFLQDQEISQTRISAFRDSLTRTRSTGSWLLQMQMTWGPWCPPFENHERWGNRRC